MVRILWTFYLAGVCGGLVIGLLTGILATIIWAWSHRQQAARAFDEDLSQCVGKVEYQ
jgi:hypothetical protein